VSVTDEWDCHHGKNGVGCVVTSDMLQFLNISRSSTPFSTIILPHLEEWYSTWLARDETKSYAAVAQENLTHFYRPRRSNLYRHSVLSQLTLEGQEGQKTSHAKVNVYLELDSALVKLQRVFRRSSSHNTKDPGRQRCHPYLREWNSSDIEKWSNGKWKKYCKMSVACFNSIHSRERYSHNYALVIGIKWLFRSHHGSVELMDQNTLH